MLEEYEYTVEPMLEEYEWRLKGICIPITVITNVKR